jgi:hypothetical protein
MADPHLHLFLQEQFPDLSPSQRVETTSLSAWRRVWLCGLRSVEKNMCLLSTVLLESYKFQLSLARLVSRAALRDEGDNVLGAQQSKGARWSGVA